MYVQKCCICFHLHVQHVVCAAGYNRKHYTIEMKDKKKCHYKINDKWTSPIQAWNCRCSSILFSLLLLSFGCLRVDNNNNNNGRVKKGEQFCDAALLLFFFFLLCKNVCAQFEIMLQHNVVNGSCKSSTTKSIWRMNRIDCVYVLCSFKWMIFEMLFQWNKKKRKKKYDEAQLNYRIWMSEWVCVCGCVRFCVCTHIGTLDVGHRTAFYPIMTLFYCCRYRCDCYYYYRWCWMLLSWMLFSI